MMSQTPGAWTPLAWERAWAPYDEQTYAAALALVRPDDVVLDIGAGDLRLARRLAHRCRQVIAVERQAHLLAQGSLQPLPDNLRVVCADAWRRPLPAGATVAVLLMRHCRQVGALMQRLRNAGCRRLVTNARSRLGVELIELQGGIPWARLAGGWFGCRCGAAGFKPLAPQALTASLLEEMHEVLDCPSCQEKNAALPA